MAREGLPFTTSTRNIGLVAHVDAGKTTTTEQMLYRSGSIRSIGRVDNGTTQTDYLQVERERGISVRAAATVLPWAGCQINLVDTPGHTDFVAEVERSLRILDGAVLVISAAEGVQAHTETLWHALRALSVPTLLFINKLDRLGADPGRVLEEIRTRLTERAVPVQALPPVEHDFNGVSALPEADLLAQLAELDDAALERYVADEPTEAGWAGARLAQLCHAGQAFPVLFGSALRGLGIAELLDAVVAYLPPPHVQEGAPLSALVFKVERDPVMGRLAYVRLYGGSLGTRDAVLLPGQAEPVRVVQIRQMHGRHHTTVAGLSAGDIGVICGLGEVRAGDVIGDPTLVPPLHRMAVPVLRVRVHPRQARDLPALQAALQEMADEDPHLEVQWQPETRELHVAMMGLVQVEIVETVLQERFGVGAWFDPPRVIYRETPVGTGEGEITFTQGGWCYLKFRIEPGEPGSGVQFIGHVLHDRLYPQFVAEVARTVPKVLRQGRMGWQVTDVRVHLL
ncbi:MAG TPA: translation factor GTPase family protein, partial [Symbiobacteriaceae bacterium]|nr:translation factor GTPase family protein [Symbiobacteriaceae bacterium]